MIPPNYVPTAEEAITLDGAAKGFTAVTMVPTSGEFKNKQADAALVTFETANVRFRLTGTPTASVGHIRQPYQTEFFESKSQLTRFLAIQVSSNASLYVTYFHKRG